MYLNGCKGEDYIDPEKYRCGTKTNLHQIAVNVDESKELCILTQRFNYHFLFLLSFHFTFLSLFFPLFSFVYFFIFFVFRRFFHRFFLFLFWLLFIYLFIYCFGSSHGFFFSPFLLRFTFFIFCRFSSFFSFHSFFYFPLCIYMTQSLNYPLHVAVDKLRHQRNCYTFAVPKRILTQPW